MIDAFNNNQLAEMVEEGLSMDEEQQGRWAEYQRKATEYKEVSRQVTELELAEKRRQAEEKDSIYGQAAAIVRANQQYEAQRRTGRQPTTPDDEALSRAD